MDPITIYRLGQLRHQEIVAQATEDTSVGKTPALDLSRRIGQVLLSWGARFAATGSRECLLVENHAGQIITVCPA
jgi:hypothetical protein